MRVLVTGGSGRLGRVLVPLLSAAGHSVRILSRVQRAGSGRQLSQVVGDLTTGAGLAEAVADIDVIVHLASNSRNAQAVDVEGTQRLIEATRATDVKHLLYVSIVGIDRIPYAYYQAKLEAERLIAESGVPFSILRATQFHSFVGLLLNEVARYPFIMPIPQGFFVQSVAMEDVAARLCRALDGPPTGRVQNFGGPEVLPVEEVAAQWINRGGHVAAVRPLPIYLPGNIAAAFRAGYNTCPDGERGTETWREWLKRSRDEVGPPLQSKDSGQRQE
jgi:uncharacterized protein YbjT (DUF2867 family)